MIIGSTKEDLTLEKRVAITPETAKNIIDLGLKVTIEKNYAEHLGFKDQEFQNVGAEIKKNSTNDVLSTCNALLKVNFPTDQEINSLKEKAILIGMLNPNKNEKKN